MAATAQAPVVAENGKPAREAGDHVAVAHPDLLPAGRSLKQRIARSDVEIERRQAELALRALD